MGLVSKNVRPETALRSPAWRWLRAVDLADSDRRVVQGSDDKHVRAAVRFVRALELVRSDRVKARLARRFPALHAAHALYAAGPSWPRWELEARLLTDESFDRIGDRLGLSGATVEAYHDVFFDVRGRLDTYDWVAHHVLGRKVRVGLTEDDIDLVLKLYAYQGGVVVLDDLLAYYREPPDPSVRTEVLDADARAALRAKLMIRSSILARGLPADGPSALRWVDVLQRAVDKLLRAEAEASLVRMLDAALGRATGPAGGITAAARSGEKGVEAA